MTASELSEVAILRLLRDVRRDLEAMDEQLRALLRHKAQVQAREEGTVLSALALSLHHYYTAFETLLSRVIRVLEGELPTGADWHVALVENAAKALEPIRPRLISSDHLSALGELRRFRHFLRNAYAVSLNPRRLITLADALHGLHPCLRADLDNLVAFLDALRIHIAAK